MNHTHPLHQEQSLKVEKAQAYLELEGLGLPTPDWFYAPNYELNTFGLYGALSDIEEALWGKHNGAGKLVGVRSQPSNPSPLGRYPHVAFTMPDFAAGYEDEYTCTTMNFEGWPPENMPYHLIINEGFRYYYWHAVVMVTKDWVPGDPNRPGVRLPNGYALVGEVAIPGPGSYGVTYGMLRPCMAGKQDLVGLFQVGNVPANSIYTQSPLKALALIGRLLYRSCCVERWVEFSHPVSKETFIAWGTR